MRRTGSTVEFALAGLALLLLAACERTEQPRPASAPTSAPAASTRPSADELANLRQFVQTAEPRSPEALPAGHPPLGENPPAPAALDLPAAGVRMVGLNYEAPATWQKEPVKSALRVDQYRWPRATGDPEDGELVVFGTNIAGGVEANVERWRSQFSGPDSQPVTGDAFHRETFAVNGMQVTFVDVTGRYSAGAMTTMGGPSPASKDNYRLLAAIVETPSGPWYFKATGPAATMAAHREEFLSFLHTMKPE